MNETTDETNQRTANVDPAEIAKFEKLASRWWDPNGDFKPLHDTNPLRLSFITERVDVVGERLLDVGCGGGILTESLARSGANACGIDMGEKPLSVARLHALEAASELSGELSYERSSAEDYAATHGEKFRAVACLEMLEHVPDFASTVAACAALTQAGGDLFFSTINRTPIAYGLLIVGAEYVANILPKGTHEYQKFIKPSELSAACRAAGLHVVEITGMRYNPFNRNASFSRDLNANYLLHARKP